MDEIQKAEKEKQIAEKKEKKLAEKEAARLKAEEKKAAGKKNSGKKKKRKWLKPLIIVLVIAGIGAFLYFRGKSGVTGYTEEKVELRNIKTYHSFTGNIEPVTEENVYPSSTQLKIKKINVEEGDEVKEGDVLMELDTDDLQESIKEQQATIQAADKTNALGVQTAQKNYDDYKNNMTDHLNSTVLTAKQLMDTDYAALVTAQRAFNSEVALNNKGLSDTILTSINAVNSAYDLVRNAEAAKKSGTDDSKDATATSAWSGYNDAVTSFEAAKQKEENQLTTLYSQLITAQTAYLDALDSYNAALRTADQTLAGFALQIETARATNDNTVNKLKLANLQRQLKDCTVTAPISGVVTNLAVKEGDMTVSGTKLATVTDFDKMKVDIKINEYDILGVSNGKKVNIDVDALHKVYQGEIAKVAKVATVDNGVSYFKSEVDFTADQDTRSGMSVEVKMPIYDLKNVPTISSDAISTDTDGTTYVMVYSADKKQAVKQKITCGATDGTYTQITKGLKNGQTILQSLAKLQASSSATVDDGNSDNGNGGNSGDNGNSGTSQ